MKTATHRHVLMLRLIALSSDDFVRWIPTPKIVEGLRAAGYVCTVRTVQRDLHALADGFGLAYRRKDGKTHEWARHKPLEAV